MSKMNKALLSLVEDNSNFSHIAPSLFGPKFAQISKDHTVLQTHEMPEWNTGVNIASRLSRCSIRMEYIR